MATSNRSGSAATPELARPKLHLRLVPTASPPPLPPLPISSETIECLETMLAAARRGQICGIAVAMFFTGGNTYQVDMAGNCKDELALTRGAIASLDDQLGKRMDAQETW